MKKDLAYFKKELIKILDKKEREEKAEIKKSLAFTMDMLIEKSSSGYPIGTIREWKGKKYQKIAPGKWRRKYSNEEKGIRMSIAALKKAIDKCSTSQELLNLVLQNRDRFADDNGRPLPIVKELSEYASAKNDKIESSSKNKIKPLSENIDTILNGQESEKEKLKQTFFKIADTSEELQAVGLKGERFVVRYGVISRHKNKDKDHDFTAEEWKDICKKINKPVLVTKYKNGYNLYLDVIKNGKHTLIGVDVKSVSRNLIINNVKTAFASDIDATEEIVLDNRNKKSGELAMSDEDQSSTYSSSTAYNLNIAQNNSPVKYEFNSVDDVKSFYKGTDKWLKAPNGKDTKLTEKQWCQVRTKNFKNWFGDWENNQKKASKIVDENGEPLVVYHGSNNSFDEFSKKIKTGYFFTSNKSTALDYTSNNNVKECFLLASKNPIVLDAERNYFTNILDSEDVKKYVNNELQENFNSLTVSNFIILCQNKKKLKDGIIFKNICDNNHNKNDIGTDYIVFKPNQIKSATDNDGSFNPKENSINKSAIIYIDNGKVEKLFSSKISGRKKTKFVVKKTFADNFMNKRSIPTLQKSIFVRGDFDDYKVSDEELKEHSIFGKTEDGCEYDLQNPTENFYYTLKKNLEKSLTWSGHKLQDRTSWNGLKISIENKKGSVRRGVDKDGHQWATKMHFDYGYIRGSEGTDGDHVDCYLGDNMDAKKVYIVHQNDPVTHKYDEDKCMLGFDTLEDAKKAYLMQYDRPGFLGKIDTMDFDEFKEFILLKRNHGKKIIKSYTDFVKSIGENFDFETMRKVCII